MGQTSSKDALDGAHNRAVLSALFKELCNIEFNANSTATQRVTVAVILAVHVLGGPGVNVDAYLAKTCVLEAETGRPPLLSVDDAMMLLSEYEALATASSGSSSSQGTDKDGTTTTTTTAAAAAAEHLTPPDFLDVVLRRVVRGRDVYAHWREAHPTESLPVDTFANVWEWMFRECKEEEAKDDDDDDHPDFMETIEAFVMNRMKKRVEGGGTKGRAAALEPAADSAAADAEVAAALSAPAATVTKTPPVGHTGTGPSKAGAKFSLMPPTRKRKKQQAGASSATGDAPEAFATRAGSKSPRLIEAQGTDGCPPHHYSPGTDLPDQEEPDRPSSTLQDDVEGVRQAPSPGTMLLLDRWLCSERTVRILATKRADQLRNECDSLSHRIAQLEEENARLRRALERAKVPRGELARKATANRALRRKIQVLEEMRQQLEAAVRSGTTEKRAVVSKCQRWEGKVKSLRDELAAKAIELTKCQAEVQRLWGRVTVMNVDGPAADPRARHQEQQIESIEQGIRRMGQREERREHHAAANQELQEQIRHLEGEVAWLSKELDMYQSLSLRRFTA
jgi:predicted  nucleic acid-binding Zn-ribbon protein